MGRGVQDDCYVLVVEDLALLRELLEQVLLIAGFQVGTATNGQEALGLVLRRPPSVIVLDLEMPVMNGIDFAHELHRIGFTIPIIVTSSAADAQERAEEVGAAAYASKPVDWKWLVATVEKMGAHRRAT